MNLNRTDLNKLRTFLVVAESLGVSRAAARLGLTRSAVSQSVSALEAALRVRLFNRVGRRLALTREGRGLHQQVREHLGQLERALDELTREAREVRGVVRVGVFLGFSRLRLARLLAGFTARHAAARVKVLYAPHGALRARLLDDRVDFVLSLGPLGEGSPAIRSARLLRQELVLVGAPRLHRGRLDLALLERLPVIDYYQGDPLIHRWIRHHFGTKPPDLQVKVWAATTDLVLELVLRQAGLAVLPRDLAEPHVKGRRLAVVETGRPELADAIWLSERAPAYPSALLAAFRAAVSTELAPG